MTPTARHFYVLSKRRHAIPVVEKPFLLDEDRDEMRSRQSENNAPSEDFPRASGDCMCEVCELPYRQHPLANPHFYLTFTGEVKRGATTH